MIAAERRGMADLIESLDAGQLRTRSLCAAWTVQQVAGHLVAAVSPVDATVLLLLVRSRFNIHRANDRLARRVADRPAAELAALLRTHADNPFQPPVVG